VMGRARFHHGRISSVGGAAMAAPAVSRVRMETRQRQT
jgi:hypothetical protein